MCGPCVGGFGLDVNCFEAWPSWKSGRLEMGFLLLARLGVVIEASPLQPWGETADTPGRRTAQAKDATAEKGHHCLQTLSGPGLLMLGILTLWLSGLAGGWICTLYGSCCTTGVYIDP